MSNPRQIRYLRELLNLSRRQVASFTRTSMKSVCEAERKEDDSPSSMRIEKWLEKSVKKAKEIQSKKDAFYKHFEIGKKYKIANEAGFIFEFMKDTGIHHCFKAIPGGWSRTYTDAQLVGVKIQEVKCIGNA